MRDSPVLCYRIPRDVDDDTVCAVKSSSSGGVSLLRLIVLGVLGVREVPGMHGVRLPRRCGGTGDVLGFSRRDPPESWGRVSFS